MWSSRGRRTGDTRADHKEAIARAAADFLPLSGRHRAVRRGHHHRPGRGDAAGRPGPAGGDQLRADRRATGRHAVGHPAAAGRRVRGLTQAAVGEPVLRALDTLRVDIAFIGANGVTVRHGLSTPDSEEAAVKRAMVRCANN